MAIPLVTQLHFSRRELQRCLEGVSAEEAVKRIEPLNCLSWIVGHLAAQEQYLWCDWAQGILIDPELPGLVGFRGPASTPPLETMWQVWREITGTADRYLKDLTGDMLTEHFEREGEPFAESIGTSLLRNIFHYWFHLGEAHAIRQVLGHTNLPSFVGRLDGVSCL